VISGFELLGDQEPFEDDRAVIYPGKVPASGLVHTLIVTDEDMYVFHEHACVDQYGDPACEVAWHEDLAGLDSFFHRADEQGGTKLTDGLIAGHYLVEAWSAVYTGFDYEEYDGGIALHYPEEAACS
jgi:hypothetical protein